MRRTLPFIAAILVLVACSAEQGVEAPAPSETSSPVQSARGTLAGNDYDPILAIRSLDPQWNEPPLHADKNYTASLGLDRTTYLWRNTSINYDRTDEGGVFMIQVRSGLPGRCDSGPDLGLAFDQFAKDFRLTAAADEIKPKLAAAWASKDGRAEVEQGTVMIRAIGGCPRALVIKAL